MADHYNLYPLKHFAAIVADAMEIELPDGYEKTIPWVSNILKDRSGGKAEKAVLYHADAVGQYIWQKYTNLFAPVYRYSSLSIPFVSTVQSVTPVAHASMYTGLDPKDHGIETYVRPKLNCSTLFDVLIEKGKKTAIIAQTDSTFLHIFAGKELDYFECKNNIEIREKALELIKADVYDVISIHTFDYDNAAHAYGPESKEGLNAISIEAETYALIAKELEKQKDKHKILLTYSPDHGQHLTEGGTGAHGSKLIEDMNVLHFFHTF